MRKPIHPKQIMAEPKQTHQFIEKLPLGLRVEICSLQKLINLWNNIVEGLPRGARAVSNPVLEHTYNDVNFTYSYWLDNANYELEKKVWDDAVSKYEVDMHIYKTSLVKKDVNKFDEKILRAEHRLANLKAARDGLPIPYPNE